MSDVDKLDEMLQRMERLLEEVQELKAMVKKAELAQYTAEEAFNRVIDDLLDIALPEWLEGPIPLESFERLFERYLVYDEDIRKTIKHLVKKGLIEVYSERWEDVHGKPHEVKVVWLSKKAIPPKPKQDTVYALVSEYYFQYWRLFGKPLTKGTVVSVQEKEMIIEKVFRTKMYWLLLEPYVRRRILFRKEDVRDFVDERADWALENIMEKYGIVKSIVDEDGIVVALEFLMDEKEALARISKEVAQNE